MVMRNTVMTLLMFTSTDHCKGTDSCRLVLEVYALPTSGTLHHVMTELQCQHKLDDESHDLNRRAYEAYSV